MTDLLLELLSEEIPARMQAKARADLARLLGEELAKAGINQIETITYATPRRLTLIVKGLQDVTASVIEEVKGPPADAPEAAIDGFLRKVGLSREVLQTRDIKGRPTLFAVIGRQGRRTASVLAEALPAVIQAFPWPKSMRWGADSVSTESLRWVRPLQGVVAMFGDEIIDFEIAGVRAGAATIGHRFHHPGAITLAGASDYVEKLRACHVIVDQDERAGLIRDGAEAAATAAGLTLVPDEGLVAENAGLTEWPRPLLGRFDPAFLEVPPEVIQLTARVNQKYFVCHDVDGALAPAFVCVANIEAVDGGAKIVEGNQKVLAARLSDARFFWEQDKKVPLERQAQKLGQIVFHEKLGTVAEKVERVAKLARWLVEEGIINPSPLQGRGLREAPGEGESGAPRTPPLPAASQLSLSPEGEKVELADLAERAARLAKADLVTQMVGEFPELQGLIGGYLAAAQGEHPAVAEAIRDHYKPVGQGDDVPSAPVTVAVCLADKLDTLCTFFIAGELPTGSKDPYALRRAALGILLLLQTNGSKLRFGSAISYAYDTLFDVAVSGEKVLVYASDTLAAPEGGLFLEHWEQEYFGNPTFVPVFFETMSSNALERPLSQEDLARHQIRWSPFLGGVWRTTRGAVEKSILGFFADRLKVQQREAGVRHDLIDAVFALGGEDDLVRLLARVRALQSFMATEDGTNLLAGYKRAANILKKEGYAQDAPKDGAALSYAPEIAEEALIAALDAAEPEAGAAVAAEDFEGAMRALATLRVPVDFFFEEVIVNDPDETKRAARLALLARVRSAVHQVADFSKIEG